MVRKEHLPVQHLEPGQVAISTGEFLKELEGTPTKSNEG
jgi:hypothetical protein